MTATDASLPPTPKPAPSTATAKAFNAEDRFSKRPYIPDVMELGRVLFNDPDLSASKKMSCASCHDPRFAYGPNNDRSTQLGGPDGTTAGLRAVPSLRYQQAVPPFTEHYYEEGGDESDQGPTGGHTWDGRADTLEVGGISRRDVRLQVADNDNLNVLGMNFLSSLSRWGVEGRWLVLVP